MAKEEINDLSQDESVTSSSGTQQQFAPSPPTSLLERTLKPTVYIPRYPKWMVGKPLLWATCFFGSLGDALFGYDQGEICNTHRGGPLSLMHISS
jgi:hypothetical protein